jgi:hypothetical protein
VLLHLKVIEPSNRVIRVFQTNREGHDLRYLFPGRKWFQFFLQGLRSSDCLGVPVSKSALDASDIQKKPSEVSFFFFLFSFFFLYFPFSFFIFLFIY